VYKVLVGKPKQRDHLEDRGIDCRMGLEVFLRRLAGGRGNGVDHLAQDRDWWQALVNVVMNFQIFAPWSSLI
jgi:hypothetical protein